VFLDFFIEIEALLLVDLLEVPELVPVPV